MKNPLQGFETLKGMLLLKVVFEVFEQIGSAVQGTAVNFDVGDFAFVAKV